MQNSIESFSDYSLPAEPITPFERHFIDLSERIKEASNTLAYAKEHEDVLHVATDGKLTPTHEVEILKDRMTAAAHQISYFESEIRECQTALSDFSEFLLSYNEEQGGL